MVFQVGGYGRGYRDACEIRNTWGSRPHLGHWYEGAHCSLARALRGTGTKAPFIFSLLAFLRTDKTRGFLFAWAVGGLLGFRNPGVNFLSYSYIQAA
jgi:hypothetical protein